MTAARLSTSRPLFSHAGWAFDAYPDLPRMNAHATMTVAEFEGPGMIDHIQTSQNWFMPWWLSRSEIERHKATAARGIIVEVFYDGQESPSVRVPIGDFFGDACAGAASDFTSLYLEKGPGSYHSWIPMPFEKSIRIAFVNETDHDYWGNTIVEGHTLDSWDGSLGYLHATWERDAFQATPDTERTLTHIDARGHLFGRSWSLATTEPLFTQTEEQQKFSWVMEANNEFRLDGEEEPSVVYTGSEDSFGFHWGFTSEFAGLRDGIVHLGSEPERLGMYRFWDPEPIRFEESLDILLTWKYEGRGSEFRAKLDELGTQDRLWVDYATTTYWYQAQPGFEHRALPAFADRVVPLLSPKAS